MKWVAFAVAVLLGGCATGKATLSCPLVFDGLVPGSSHERDVVALYGEGVHDPDGGDAGARSYSGGDGRLVRFIFGMDYVLDRVVIEKDSSAPAETVALDTIRFWQRLLPGRTTDEVRLVLGEPHSGDDTEMIYLPAGGSCLSGGFVSFETGGGIVQRVIVARDDDG